jgi:hypothetical protein
MVSVLDWSVVDPVFDPLSDKNKDYEIDIC